MIARTTASGSIGWATQFFFAGGVRISFEQLPTMKGSLAPSWLSTGHSSGRGITNKPVKGIVMIKP